MYSKDTAAFIWAEFIRSVHRSRPDLLSGSFDKPGNVVSVDIDSMNGCRSNGPRSINEFFIDGTEPPPCVRPKIPKGEIHRRDRNRPERNPSAPVS
jgi:hypothetical protein